MTRAAVLFLGLSFALFGFGVSLQCYHCPGGSAGACEVKQDCGQDDDACIKLTSGDTTYSHCVSYADCNFRTMSTRYLLPEFTFDCCQSKLCNGEKKSILDKLRDIFS